MKVTSILEGKPFMTEFGIVGYSSVILIQEEEKNILYDCGQRGCALHLKENLKKAGLVPEDITHVVLSHLHFDHVGNLPLFSNAVILLHEREWLAANDAPDEWTCIATREFLRYENRMQFVKEGDCVSPHARIVELPGHTPGLIGLKCGEDIMLCSDAIKNRYEMWENIPLMTKDIEASMKSSARVKEKAVYIYPGHDAILQVDNPINKEELSFELQVANGKRMPVVI